MYYSDKGQILATNNLPTGGSIESGWFDDSQEVWDMRFLVMNDQQVDIMMYCRDTELVEDTVGQSLYAGVPISASYQSIMTGQRPGFSFKIVVVNNSGFNITNLKVRLSCMGQ